MISAYYWNRTLGASGQSTAADDIPVVGSVFYLKSGARARLVDRSGTMVIVEVEKRHSDWIQWTEVKARIQGEVMPAS